MPRATNPLRVVVDPSLDDALLPDAARLLVAEDADALGVLLENLHNRKAAESPSAKLDCVDSTS